MKITAKTSATGSENLSALVKNNWLTKVSHSDWALDGGVLVNI